MNALLNESEIKNTKSSKDMSSLESNLQDTQVQSCTLLSYSMCSTALDAL